MSSYSYCRAMLYDNSRPRYLPHVDKPQVLLMGLAPMADAPWVETDTDIGRYHRHKLAQRQARGDGVYRAQPRSLPAQRELRDALRGHLLAEQADHYQAAGEGLHCLPGNFEATPDDLEPLWGTSLWVADDLVLMEKQGSAYHLTAASLCSPSHWRLEEKMGLPLVDIHAPVPGLSERIGAKIERFMAHLKPSHPVERFNWSLQADDALCARAPQPDYVDAATELFYRTERQTLRRLPQTGAIVFTIRVYLHSLSALQQVPHCLARLRSAIASAPPAMAQYKHFATYQAALEKYRGDTR